jgi:hypothetical protein
MMAAMDLAQFAAYEPEINDFWRYWSSLPKTNLVPHLRDYLDGAPPKLQPSVALVDVFGPEEFSLRMAGTAIVEAIGGEPKQPGMPEAYREEARKAAARMQWAAVNRPCGYTSKRVVQSRSGQTLMVQSIALPLITDRDNCKTLVNYGNLARSVSEMRTTDRLSSMQALQLSEWVDIGAGVPSAP